MDYTESSNDLSEKRFFMKTAIVTGASSGLGREYVRRLDRRSLAGKEPLDEIWVIARRRERLAGLKEECRTPVRILSADLTEESSMDEIRALLKKESPDVRMLICAAGFGKIGNYETVGRENELRMIDLNCRAAVDITQSVLPYMSRGSCIIEVCSTAAFQPFQELNVYAASKSFLLHYTRGLSAELSPRRIKVCAVCPYWIRDTEFIPVAKETKSASIRHFPLSSRVSSVAAVSLWCARAGLPVSTPGIVCTVHRIVSMVPDSLLMLLWALLRRL